MSFRFPPALITDRRHHPGARRRRPSQSGWFIIAAVAAVGLFLVASGDVRDRVTAFWIQWDVQEFVDNMSAARRTIQEAHSTRNIYGDDGQDLSNIIVDRKRPDGIIINGDLVHTFDGPINITNDTGNPRSFAYEAGQFGDVECERLLTKVRGRYIKDVQANGTSIDPTDPAAAAGTCAETGNTIRWEIE